MKKDNFTTEQYLQAIDRELGKRVTTYPKILAKMKKRTDIEPEQFDNEIVKQHQQVRRLKNARFLIESPPIGEIQKHFSNYIADEALYELTREYKMRLSYYPRLVWLDRNRDRKRLDQVTADYEIAVWKSLCFWFAKEYFDLDVLPPLTSRGKPIQQ